MTHFGVSTRLHIRWTQVHLSILFAFLVSTSAFGATPTIELLDKRIITVDFHELVHEEAIARLQSLISNSDPALKDFKIEVVKTAPLDRNFPNTSLLLKKVSPATALKYLASIVDCKITFKDDKVIFTQLPPLERISPPEGAY